MTRDHDTPDQIPDAVECDELLERSFELLDSPRRRMTILLLYGVDATAEEPGTGTIERSEITTRIAAIENQTPPDDLRGAHLKPVKEHLRTTDLPLLHRLDIIEYDDRSGTVRTTERTKAVGLLLTAFEETVKCSGLDHLDEVRDDTW